MRSLITFIAFPCLLLITLFTSVGQAQVLYTIQYDDGQVIYYSGRPQPGDTCGVWFEPPTDCKIVSASFLFNDNMGGDAEVFISTMAPDFDPDNYYDSDEPGWPWGPQGSAPSPLGDILAGPITYSFDNSGDWQVIVFEEWGYPPESLDVGTDPFFIGYVLLGGMAQPYFPSILGDAGDDRPYHSLCWLTEPSGMYVGESGWWAYGIDWMLRATVLLYGDPPPEISDLDDPPDTYLAGSYTITATITDIDSTGIPGSGQVDEARLIYSVDGAPEDTVMMVNTIGDEYEGDIPTVPVGSLINFRVEADDNNGLTAIAPDHAGYNFSFLQPSGADILLVNDSGGNEGLNVYVDALQNGGYNYDYWYINYGDPLDMGYPGSDVINTDIYAHIIWYNGIDWMGSLPDNDANLTTDPVANFMDDGGNFFLSSSDYLGYAFNPDDWDEFTAIPGTFMFEYLKVESGWSDSHLDPYTGQSCDTLYIGVDGDPVSHEFSTGYFGNHPDPNWNDFCYPLNVAETCFLTEIDDEPAGIRYEGRYKMVFLPWPLECCDDWMVSEGILQNVLEYFGSGVPALTVTLTPYNPPVQIPASGGSFDFNVAILNGLPTQETFDAWIMATLPNGMQVGPLLGPVNLTLQSGQSIDRDRTQAVPAGAPAGNYMYTGYIGYYPTTIIDQDEFPFQKLATGDGIVVGEWENSGESFDLWLTQPEAEIPGQYAFSAAYPNPFNPVTRLTLTLPEAARVDLKIYDVSGRLVAKLIDGWRAAGIHDVIFNATDLPSGIYIARFQAGSFSATQKMVLVK